MSAGVGGERNPFDRPAFAVRQILFGEPGEELADLGCGLLVILVFDFRAIARRIGDDVVLQRDRYVDDFSGHDLTTSWPGLTRPSTTWAVAKTAPLVRRRRQVLRRK